MLVGASGFLPSCSHFGMWSSLIQGCCSRPHEFNIRLFCDGGLAHHDWWSCSRCSMLSVHSLLLSVHIPVRPTCTSFEPHQFGTFCAWSHCAFELLRSAGRCSRPHEAKLCLRHHARCDWG